MENTTQNNFDKLANIFTNNINIEDVTTQDESIQEDDIETAKSGNDIKQDEKDKKIESDKSEETKKVSGELEDEIKKLKKRLDESQTWGHKKNLAYVHAKKKVGEFLKKLNEDEVLTPDELNNVLSYFDNVDIEEEVTSSNEKSKFNNVKEKLDNEFSVFKKYAKVENAEDKYNAFFYFWPMLGSKEQEKLSVYFEEEPADIAIDQIMSMGEQLYNNLYKGIEKHGGIIDYVKSLNEKNDKLQTKIKELEKNLDNTTDTVYSRSINSKVQEERNTSSKQSLADIWRNG
jgi:regulator of replication initiation timing